MQPFENVNANKKRKKASEKIIDIILLALVNIR